MKGQRKAERPQAEGVTPRPANHTAHVEDSIHDAMVSSKATFGASEVEA